MSVVAIREHPNGRRVFVGPCRVHHGLTGLVACAAALSLPPSVVTMLAFCFGVWAMADDARDFPWLLSREPLFA